MPFVSASQFCLDIQGFKLSNSLRKRCSWDGIHDLSLIVRQLTFINGKFPKTTQTSDQVLDIPHHVAQMYAILLQSPGLPDLVSPSLGERVVACAPV